MKYTIEEYSKLKQAVQFLWPHYVLSQRRVPYFKKLSNNEYQWHSSVVDDFSSLEKF